MIGSEYLLGVIESNGLISLFIFMAFNGFIGFPPSELVLFLGGFSASIASYSFVSALLSSFFGALLGSYMLFLVGRAIGYKWILKVPFMRKVFSERFIHLIAHTLKDEGAYWIGIFRCFPVIRSIVSIPAGMIGMPHKVFLLWTGLGLMVWAVVWSGLGYILGISFLKYHIYVTIALLVLLAIALWIFKKHMHGAIREKYDEEFSFLREDPKF
tara:strand:+ start:121 stop:759 length:639 start_codon:yes stop_codon:yes gene_type:complete